MLPAQLVDHSDRSREYRGYFKQEICVSLHQLLSAANVIELTGAAPDAARQARTEASAPRGVRLAETVAAAPGAAMGYTDTPLASLFGQGRTMQFSLVISPHSKTSVSTSTPISGSYSTSRDRSGAPQLLQEK